jgi:hypothetical protein
LFKFSCSLRNFKNMSFVRESIMLWHFLCNLNRAMKHCKAVLFLLDVFIVLTISFPLSILHWRGTWQLQEYYFFPNDKLNSLWLSFAIGSNVCIVELLLQPFLKEKLSTCQRCVYIIVSRLHLYIHGWGVLCYWRGLWGLLDFYLSPGWVNSIIVFGIFQFLLTVTQTIRTAVGLPVSLRLDTSRDLLEPDLVFKTSVSIKFRCIFQFLWIVCSFSFTLRLFLIIIFFMLLILFRDLLNYRSIISSRKCALEHL